MRAHHVLVLPGFASEKLYFIAFPGSSHFRDPHCFKDQCPLLELFHLGSAYNIEPEKKHEYPHV